MTPLVAAENAKAGSTAWLPQRLRFTPGGTRGEFIGASDQVTWLDSGRSHAIEGWCSEPSVRAGHRLAVYVSTAPAVDFTLDIFRMGYYGGLGARHMAAFGPLRGSEQPDPTPRTGRLIECAWEPSHEFTIPDDWPSGVYLGKLARLDNGIESYVIFVVRDEREAHLIAQTSDFTWQAYNRWPYAHSLYSNGDDDLTAYYGTDVAVSFDRPYLSTTYFNSPLPGSGEFFVFEYPFIFWLERMGYDVTYCSNLDTHRGTAEFSRATGFLSIGHDEYVTVSMYENLMAARDSGVSLGFFNGNSYCFNVDLRAGTDGRPDRVFSRADAFGPDRSPGSGYVPHPDEAAYGDVYPFPLLAPDEGLLMGARNHWPVEGVGDWVCSLPDHWIFDGTGMREGESIPNLVGHEWHGNPADIPGLEVVSRGRTWEPGLGDGEYSATVYPGPDGNIVFNAATCWWGSGLSHPPGFQRPTWHEMPSGLPDDRVQRITQNVLDRMIER
ncbi:N,N-dimethylformamidase beta subunit family domain-containing protein [Nonomuraea sp. CA-143628]|uniref:N,N-dimethylformamidase beta subunit family domain-containing protein n=1 Tax=Nonomuraea sp. CA-143628 TaxID=3239997 RepID=UPI003D91057C